MHRNADGIRRALHIVHKLLLAAGEAHTADEEDPSGHEQLRSGQIILVERRSRGRKHQKYHAVPDHTRLQQAGNVFFHCRGRLRFFLDYNL